MRRNKKIIPLIIIFLIIFNLSQAQVDQEQIYKFNQVIENISNYYVDSVNNAKLIENAIISTLKELDPHSVYFSKDKVEEINRGLIGSFVGVGLTYDIINDTILVLSTVKNGPSEQAGLKPGDRIIKVEDEIIAGTSITDDKIKDLLTGEKGTDVTIFINRKKTGKLKKIKITRSDIPVKSIDAAYLTDEGVAYIRLNRFSATTIKEFNKATDTLMTGNTNKLVLDLRNNSGGYLFVSVKLLEFFLSKNTVVLSTKGIHQSDKEYKTQKTGKYRNTEIVVLINERSASASEIFSGAIQDWDRGIIIGRRSFGKGLVQKPIYLIDGSMMRLTIAKYYTPSGRNIQKSYKEGVDEYNNEVKDRLINGELMHKDSIKYIDSLKFYTLNNKRMIYGGGGIMPDIYIPVDTLIYPYFFRQTIKNGKINEYIHIYVDDNREELYSKYVNFKKFNEYYKVSGKEIYEMAAYLYNDDEKKEEYVEILLKNELILLQIKALVANDLWGESEYYEIINTKDEIFLKAVEVLINKKKYSDILLNDIVGDYRD